MFFFLPYRVGRRLQHVPWVTIALIAINVVASIAFFGYMDRVYEAAQYAYVHGASEAEVIAGLIRTLGYWMFYPDWRGLYTWLTSAFLHGNLMHLVSNMFFLYLFGSVVEDAVGKWRYLALYIGGAAASSLLYGATSLLIPGGARLALGASGALAAVMGIFATRFYKTRMRYFYLIIFRAGTFETSSVVGVALWGASELAYGLLQFGGLSSGTAHWAHLGGLAFGVAAAFGLGFLKDASRDYLLDETAHYVASGAHDVAAAKYAELAKADPSDPFWMLSQARETLLAGRGDLRQAALMYARAVEKLLLARRFPEALDAYEQYAGDWSAFTPRVLLAVGSAAESAGRRDLARGAYLRVANDHSRSPEAEKALFRLAHVYLIEGDRAEAVRWWDQFARSYPGSQWNAFADPAFTQQGA